jgi:hypothetical protein
LSAWRRPPSPRSAAAVNPLAASRVKAQNKFPVRSNNFPVRRNKFPVRPNKFPVHPRRARLLAALGAGMMQRRRPSETLLMEARRARGAFISRGHPLAIASRLDGGEALEPSSIMGRPSSLSASSLAFRSPFQFLSNFLFPRRGIRGNVVLRLIRGASSVGGRRPSS